MVEISVGELPLMGAGGSLGKVLLFVCLLLLLESKSVPRLVWPCD